MTRTLIFALLALPNLRAGDAIDRLASEAQRAWKAPAIGVCIVRTGQPTVIRTWGVRELGKPEPATVDDFFPIASCTKAFTTALIARLVDERRMEWDEPLRKHLPEFHLSDAEADAQVTLRDLLTHRTGVNGHDLLWYRNPWSNAELLKRMQKLPLQEPFRKTYQYSTLMYLAAGQAAANAAGQPWQTAVSERLLKPLGMKNVAFNTVEPAFKDATKLIGHRYSKAGAVEVMPRYEITEPNPAGSINLSLRDLEPWLKLHLQGNVSAVSAANLGVTHTPQIAIPMVPGVQRQNPETVQLEYGMGWIVGDYRGVKTLAHGGIIDGFRTLIMIVPSRGLAFAIVANLHETRLNAALANALLDHHLGLPAKDWNAIHLKVIDAEKTEVAAAAVRLAAMKRELKPRALPLADYAGSYTNAAYGTAKVVVADGVLHLHWSSFQTPLDYFGNDAFSAASGMLESLIIEFQSLQDKVRLFRFQGQIFTRE